MEGLWSVIQSLNNAQARLIAGRDQQRLFQMISLCEKVGLLIGRLVSSKGQALQEKLLPRPTFGIGPHDGNYLGEARLPQAFLKAGASGSEMSLRRSRSLIGR